MKSPLYLTGLTIVNFLISCARDSGLSNPVTLVLRRVLWNGFFVFIATVMASRIYILGMYLFLNDFLKFLDKLRFVYLSSYLQMTFKLIFLDIFKRSIFSLYLISFTLP